LKKYFVEYQAFLLFLGKFLGSYLVLSILYIYYLSFFDANSIDWITKKVASTTNFFLNLLNPNSTITIQGENAQVFYNKQYVSRIIEGCNGISVEVLFISFILAFSNKIKTTFSFIMVGAIAIFFLNIFRIVLLSILLYYYPEQEHLLHGVFFPIIIYGFVFLLWLYWIAKFSKK